VHNPFALDPGLAPYLRCMGPPWDEQPTPRPDPREKKGNRFGRRSSRLGNAHVMGGRGEGLGPAVPGLDIREAERPDHHPLEMVAALPGFQQEDLALGMKDREGQAREPGSRAHVYQGADVRGNGRIQGGRVENQTSNHRLGRAMPGEIHPVSPRFDEGRKLCEGFQGSPLRREGGKLPEALGQQPNELRLGGI
jgi:hypothetical protein